MFLCPPSDQVGWRLAIAVLTDTGNALLLQGAPSRWSEGGGPRLGAFVTATQKRVATRANLFRGGGEIIISGVDVKAK